MRHLLRPSAAWLGVAALLLTGCSGAASSPTGESPAAASPSALETLGMSAIPLGTYAAEIPEGVEAAPGTWTMEVTTDRIVWTNPETGARFSPGEVTEVTGSSIEFAPDPQCPDQGGTPTAGSYEWSWDGDQLTFTVDSDSCAGRRDTLTSAPWEPTP